MLKAFPFNSEKNRILILSLKSRTQKFINICQITHKQAHSIENYFKETKTLSKIAQMRDHDSHTLRTDKPKQKIMKASKKIRKHRIAKPTQKKIMRVSKPTKIFSKFSEKKIRKPNLQLRFKSIRNPPKSITHLKAKFEFSEFKNSRTTACLQEIKNRNNLKQQKPNSNKFLPLQETENIPTRHDPQSLQLKQLDRNLQNQMLYHSYSINQFFGRVIDCFRRSFTINGLEVPSVCKTNEKNALITMLNQFMLYIRSFKVDLRSSVFRKELEKNVVQNLKEISAKFQKFKNLFPVEEREKISEEIAYMDKILQQKADFNNIMKLKPQEEIFMETTDSHIQEALSDFMGNMIQGIDLVEKVRSSFENSKDEAPGQKLKKLKLEVDEKLQNPSRLFKANEIFPFFADLVNFGLLKKNYKIIVNLVAKMDQEDFKNYSEEIEKSTADPEDIRVLFCEVIEEINNKKMFLL